MITYRKATPKDSEALSRLAIESKGHWGYSREQLEIWRKDLRVEKDYIQMHTVRTVWLEAELVGFFAIKKGTDNFLDHLWLLPKAIGKGIGRLVFEEVLRVCKEIGVKEFIIVSDPDAEGFYLHLGAIKIGEVESKPQNRMLPKLRYSLGDYTEPVAGGDATRWRS